MHAAPHISVSCRDPDAHTAGDRDHRNARRVAVTNSGEACEPIFNRVPLTNSTRIAVVSGGAAAGGDFSCQNCRRKGGARSNRQRLFPPSVDQACRNLELARDIRNDGTWCKPRCQNPLPLLVAPPAPTLRPSQHCYLGHAVRLCVLIRTSLRVQTHNQPVTPQGGPRRRDTIEVRGELANMLGLALCGKLAAGRRSSSANQDGCGGRI